MIPLWMTVIVAGAVDVRVGVQVVRAAVGRPARVGEADRRRSASRSASAVARLASLPARFSTKTAARLGHERDPGRVVAAVLEARAAPRGGSGPPRGDPCSRRCRTCRLSSSVCRRARAARGASLGARPRAPRARRRARETSAGVRALDHDPQRGLGARRPDEDAPAGRELASRGARSRAASSGSASHWSLCRTWTARCSCGNSGIAAASSSIRPAGRAEDPQDLERGDDPVAGVACSRTITWPLFSPPRPAPGHLHPVEDVLVARPASGRPARRRPERRREAAVREDA